MSTNSVIITLFLAFLSVPIVATSAVKNSRIPVLAQVNHPHTYYWREMYMPQLTSGPSSASFSPDGKSVIYSQRGSLWRQKLGEDTAYELTVGPGYDYQPDWSPSGKSVVFTRQKNNALNLMLLDLETGSVKPLTQGNAVNLEPRWSPAGDKIAFVSTKLNGFFDIFVATLKEGELVEEMPLVAGNVTQKYRYYYSQEDHAINPSWSADGKMIYYVSNPEVAWGSGDIWSVSVDNPQLREQVLVEETTWAAKPELAHDGKRLLYSSYRGRQWHQLWLTTPVGKYPLPLTFGEFDIKQARWSADDRHLIYVSNEDGGLSLWHHTIVGGARVKIEAKNRVYKREMRDVDITLKNDLGALISGRVSVMASDGRHYGPDEALMRADDYVDQDVSDHENHYFHCDKNCRISVPQGNLKIMASHGFSHKVAQISLDASKQETDIVLTRNDLPTEYGQFTSADLHVHMNYGGQYKQTLEGLSKVAEAEDLDIIYNLPVNKEERIPDISQFKTTFDTINGVTLYQGQEYHSSYWGHLALLHLDDHFLTADFSSYWDTAMASPYPANATINDLAHEQSAVTGYVHLYDGVPNPEKDAQLTHSLPIDAALGKIDFLEVVGFADHKDAATVWYRLLNLGLKVSAGGGTDAMSNYASLRGPVGLNRLYMEGVKQDNPASIKDAIKAGRGYVSNAPQIGLLVNGKKPGDVISLNGNGETLKIKSALRSNVPVDHFELVMNGKVLRRFKTGENGMTADIEMDLEVDESGWILVRATNDKANPFVQDIYTYATTNPIWLEVDGSSQNANIDAEYFIAWLDRIKEHVSQRQDFNHPWEREIVLREISQARKIYQEKIK